MIRTIEFLYNVILYFIWRGDFKFDILVGQFLERIFYGPDAKKRKVPKRRTNYDIGLNSYTIFIYSTGFWAFGWGNIALSLFVTDRHWLILVMLASVPNFLAIAYFVEWKNKYKEYFKYFQRKTDAWHRKWTFFTIFFCVGSILWVIISFYICDIQLHISK